MPGIVYYSDWINKCRRCCTCCSCSCRSRSRDIDIDYARHVGVVIDVEDRSIDAEITDIGAGIEDVRVIPYIDRGRAVQETVIDEERVILQCSRPIDDVHRDIDDVTLSDVA